MRKRNLEFGEVILFIIVSCITLCIIGITIAFLNAVIVEVF